MVLLSARKDSPISVAPSLSPQKNRPLKWTLRREIGRFPLFGFLIEQLQDLLATAVPARIPAPAVIAKPRRPYANGNATEER
jgi:hypothetical protein